MYNIFRNQNDGFMKYRKITKGIFVSRPNRFIAVVNIDGREETVHVKNTGRCRELLVPGVTVYLEESDNLSRKTRYDLVTVEKLRDGKPPLTVNMDSQAANDIAEEWLRESGLFSAKAVIRREVTHGASRFDFCIDDGKKRSFLEVKGVTLETEGIAAFPDAPTERGVKHINELAECAKAGYGAYILFVIQMKEITKLVPNDETHKAFGDALRQAQKAGVKILAVDCAVTPDTVRAENFVQVELNR